MKTGMLWFDNSDKSLLEKVEECARHFQEKYGMAPNTCHVNDRQTEDQTEERESPSGIRIRASSVVLPNHFWMGIEWESVSLDNSEKTM
jgi:hypothetical protein